MSKDIIGIKLADGTFYPVLQEGSPAEKKLELTTVRDGQTTVQLNLYKSSTGKIEDSEYVDTLLIENLLPHPKQEPSIDLKIKIDENDVLSAEIDDPETGESSNINVSLINLPKEHRDADFSMQDESLTDLTTNSDFPEDFSMQDDSLSDLATNDDSLEDFSMQDDSLSDLTTNNDSPEDFSMQDDSLSDLTTNNDSPEDFSMQDDSFPDFSKPIIEEPIKESNTEIAEMEEEMSLENSFDPVFDETIDSETSNNNDSNDLILPDELEIEESIFDAPDQEISTDDQSFEDLDNIQIDEDIPSIDDKNILSEIELPNFDENPIFTDNNDSQEETDFESENSDITISDEAFVMPEPSLDDENTTLSDEAFVMPEPSLDDENTTLSDEAFVMPEPSLDDENTTLSDEAFVMPEPSLDDENTTLSDEAFVMPEPSLDDDFSTSFDIKDEPILDDTKSLPSDEDFIMSETKSVENSLDDEEPFSFDSLPDFDDIPETSESFDENSFSMPDFDDEPTEKVPGEIGMQTFDDKDLFEQNIEEEEKRQRKTALPVTVCIICAIICILALLAIAFIVPTKFSSFSSDKIEITEVEPITEIEQIIQQPTIEKEAPKENIIVVTEEPVPPTLPPTPVEENTPTSIKYLIKWGDTLWDLADTYYKNPWLYKKIAKANNIKNPNLIISGTYINIPPK